MKKQKQSLFTKKFDQLNSQDNCEDILWSSSESSDCENKSKTMFNNSFTNSRKRKRKIRRVNKNVSNLDVIIEVSRNDKMSEQTSALRTDYNNLNSEKRIIETSLRCKQLSRSPVLKSRCLKSFKNDVNIPIQHTSPILTSTLLNNEKSSPVLEPRRSSPRITPNVKKKLFISHNQMRNIQKLFNQSCGKHNAVDNELKPLKSHEQEKLLQLNLENINNKEILETTSSDSINNKPKTHSELIKRVQTYFDSQFSSESTSQQTISECETATQNTSKSSDEIEINNSMTQTKDLQLNQTHSSPLSSCETNINEEKPKKTRYKKGGLAHRLAGLIKKQNSNISLWQHEKFLATNSNFIIPKCEHTMFRIQNVHFKYGCYLIEARDFNNEQYELVINAISVNCNSVIAPNYIFKLYKPYKLLEIENQCKIIVNVCKFECLPLVL